MTTPDPQPVADPPPDLDPVLAYAYSQISAVFGDWIDTTLQADEDEWAAFLESLPDRQEATVDQALRQLNAFCAELSRRSRTDYTPQPGEVSPVQLNDIVFTQPANP